MKYFILYLLPLDVNTSTIYFIFFSVFFTTIVMIPMIRDIALRRSKLVIPNHRSSHIGKIPAFGGVSFFLCYFVITILYYDVSKINITLLFLTALSFIFITGFLDDLKNISPKKKLLGQSLAVMILMLHPEFRINSLHGFMDINEIPAYVSFIGSSIVFLAIINAFNLLDGIDGLTSITGIMVSLFYAFMYLKLKIDIGVIFCLTTIGTLLAFLRYNFSKKQKIFMGDTGSLIIGFILGLQTINFLAIDELYFKTLVFDRSGLPLLLIGILFVPILDTGRVIVLRAVNGLPIFSPDRNHIHHIIVDYGFSHWKTSIGIGFVNFCAGLIMFQSIRYLTIWQSFTILIGMFLGAFILLFAMNRNYKSLKDKVRIKKIVKKIFG